MLQMDSTLSGKSFMYIKKNRRPSTDPWGIPNLTSSQALKQLISKQGQQFAINSLPLMFLM